jgi:hydroxypyruvate reductase
MLDLLIVGRPLDFIVRRLGEEFRVTVVPEGARPRDLLPERRAAVNALTCIGGGSAPAEDIAALPNLRVIANFGAGYDRIDVGAAKARGIAISYLPGVTATCVADHAFALMLAATRGIVAGQRHVESGAWIERRFPLMRRASGRKLGIYGLGAIGREAAKRAQGFDMAVGYHNRRRADVPYRYFPSLRDLAAWADVLLVACPASEETKGTVNAQVLDALGPEGLLVNIARGTIVDEDALVAALDDGRIAGAALDVLAVEPSRPERLVGRDNVVLTPHVAGGTHETWRDATERLAANLSAFARTGSVLDPIPE